VDDDDEDFGVFNLFIWVCFGFDLINVEIKFGFSISFNGVFFFFEECYLNNQSDDNLFDNHTLQRKKWYWHGNHNNREIK